MTRIRTHNLRAKRRVRKAHLGYTLPSQWRQIFLGMDLGREPATVVYGAPRYGKSFVETMRKQQFELLNQRFVEGKLILHTVSKEDLREYRRDRPDWTKLYEQRPEPLSNDEIVRAHNAGELSEGQASRILGVDRVTLRMMADAMRNLE